MTTSMAPAAASRLQGKTIFITAAAQGIGRASALACAQAGARVIASDISATGLSALQRDCHNLAGIEVLDVRDPAAIAAVAKKIPDLDALFNCAGMVAHGSLLDCSEDDWDKSFALNVKSMYLVTRAFLPGMLRRGAVSGAAIINMASMASSIKGFANRCAYGATKAAVIGFTKSLAADYVRAGLRANALCPGTVDTPSLRGRIANAPDPVQAEKDFLARQPMGRLALPEEIAPMVVYLASDESRMITGQALLVDGGVTI